MRKIWAASLAVALGASALGGVRASAAPKDGGKQLDITLLATTDVHGNVANWDYFKNA